MIVTGRAEMTDPLSAEARSQLHLRQDLAARTAVGYATAGVTAVVQDLYLGQDLVRFLSQLRHQPVYLVVLAPRVDVIERRELARTKTGYSGWRASEFDRHLRLDTARSGLWIDNSDLNIQQTVDVILERLPSALIAPAGTGG